MLDGKRVLVVDDEADLREILREELTYEKAEVIEANNGLQAYEILKASNIDAVLSDMRMPGGDGAVLTQKIRLSFGSKPIVILLTGFADLSSEDAFSIGADGYVYKPFHLSDLKKTLINLLKKPDQRWKKTTESIQSTYEIKESLKFVVDAGKFNLGRGGACLKMSKGQQVIGEFIKIKFSEENFFIGKIVWMRDFSGANRQSIGVEFHFVSDSMFKLFNETYPDWENLLYFIPRCQE